jgi:hypothetical protein
VKPLPSHLYPLLIPFLNFHLKIELIHFCSQTSLYMAFNDVKFSGLKFNATAV